MCGSCCTISLMTLPLLRYSYRLAHRLSSSSLTHLLQDIDVDELVDALLARGLRESPGWIKLMVQEVDFNLDRVVSPTVRERQASLCTYAPYIPSQIYTHTKVHINIKDRTLTFLKCTIHFATHF